MDIKVDCKLLSEQIQLMDMYSSVISNEHNKELVDGIANLLSEIYYSVETGMKINFEKVN